MHGKGAIAKATQEEMMVWINHADKGTVWKLQYDMRNSLDGKLRLISTYTVNPRRIAPQYLTCSTRYTGTSNMLEPLESRN